MYVVVWPVRGKSRLWWTDATRQAWTGVMGSTSLHVTHLTTRICQYWTKIQYHSCLWSKLSVSAVILADDEESACSGLTGCVLDDSSLANISPSMRPSCWFQTYFMHIPRARLSCSIHVTWWLLMVSQA